MGPLDLQEREVTWGVRHLIMGPPEDIWQGSQDSATAYTYTLGKRSWAEWWPSEAECGGDVGLAKRCAQLAAFISALMEKGCLS
ncbi:hypothetical protein COCON_G00021150 [Conger conger]|uniref:Uncharacterized protein n=1 Tax=Conger conger TaxID=82655 RepID=A0A9Q1DWP8_CONCO|nr:hypothetical protein COCON_G00021150 [Conger conger]